MAVPTCLLSAASLGDGFHLGDAIIHAGHRSLLIGNYGNFGLTWWGNLSLIALLRAGGTLARELRAVARESNRASARVFAADVLMPTMPIGLRRLVHRLRRRDPDSVTHYSALNPSFVAESGLARQWQAQGFDPWFGQRDWNAARWRAYRLFDHNQYGRDTRGQAADILGYELRDPHGDRRLICAFRARAHGTGATETPILYKSWPIGCRGRFSMRAGAASTRRPGSARSTRGGMTSPQILNASMPPRWRAG
jgi:hypothetical protein